MIAATTVLPQQDCLKGGIKSDGEIAELYHRLNFDKSKECFFVYLKIRKQIYLLINNILHIILTSHLF